MLAAPASPLPPELLVELPLELPLLLLLPDPLELPLVLLPPEPLVELPPELPLLLLPPEPPVELPPELPLLLPPEVLPLPDPESPSDEAATTSSMLASPSPPLSAERPQLRERVTAVDRVKTPRPVIFIFIEHPLRLWAAASKKFQQASIYHHSWKTVEPRAVRCQKYEHHPFVRSAPHFVVCSLYALALAKVRAQSGQLNAMYGAWTFAQSADSI